VSLAITPISKSGLRIEAEAPVTLDAAEVERLIAQLAKFRKTMTPEVPRKPPDGTLDPGEVDPIVGVQPFPDYMVMMIRHPGIGWLPLFLPEGSAQELGRFLLQPVPTTTTRRQ